MSKYLCMYICMYACLCGCKHVCINARLHVCTCMCMHVTLCVCLYNIADLFIHSDKEFQRQAHISQSINNRPTTDDAHIHILAHIQHACRYTYLRGAGLGHSYVPTLQQALKDTWPEGTLPELYTASGEPQNLQLTV